MCRSSLSVSVLTATSKLRLSLGADTARSRFRWRSGSPGSCTSSHLHPRPRGSRIDPGVDHDLVTTEAQAADPRFARGGSRQSSGGSPRVARRSQAPRRDRFRRHSAPQAPRSLPRAAGAPVRSRSCHHRGPSTSGARRGGPGVSAHNHPAGCGRPVDPLTPPPRIPVGSKFVGVGLLLWLCRFTGTRPRLGILAIEANVPILAQVT